MIIFDVDGLLLNTEFYGEKLGEMLLLNMGFQSLERFFVRLLEFQAVMLKEF